MSVKTLLVGLVLAPVLTVSCSAVGPSASAPSASVQPSPTPLPPSMASSTSPPASAESGVQGRTMVDGGCPVPVENSPCPARPIRSRITIVRIGSEVTAAVVTSDAAGRFQVALPPGSYRLQPANLTGTPFPRGTPVEVAVRSGHYTDLTVWFDSGIQ
jgi:hypothetical protein